MASTSLSTFFQSLKHSTDASEFAARQRLQIRVMAAFFLVALAFFMPDAMAQQVEGICGFARFLKQLVAGAAIVAVLLFIINSFFLKSSVIGDIIMYVIIGCVIAVAVVFIIESTGLAVTCTL
ncbi:hypothetical protein [Hydrogenophaga sp. NFH-34]|uniref:hypothetical protein n=1 Tax=Hydrogenophaga sp. NFH-34 TaxID=2744446 RepID=UPI001F36E6F6|nr:hypothetical protein [Hydrogenophaga sp. NFH-34]